MTSIAMLGTLLVALAGLAPAAAMLNLRRELNSSLAGTPLPPSAAAALRKLEHDVESLKKPSAPQQAPPTIPAQQLSVTEDCSLFGDLVSTKISSQCCTNAQVVTQRQLAQYAMARKCKLGWQCEADSKTPLPTFEKTSLSSMCGEPGCLPKVVSAMKSNPMTIRGADDMSNICNSLASIGGNNASPAAVSQLLGSGGPSERREKRECKKTYCKSAFQRDMYCDEKKENPKDERWCAQQTLKSAEWCTKERERCDEHCCKSSSCFPGEAVVQVLRKGKVPVAELMTGDSVLVMRSDQLAYEPVLSFLHTIGRSSAKAMPFVIIAHERGEFRASATHIVFVSVDSDGHAWTSKLVGALQVGDRVFAAGNGLSGGMTPSLILTIRRGTTQSGMYAPLTASGTIVVDGVVASNYASSSESKHLTHNLAHAFLFPVRLYHRLGLAHILQPVWQRFCSSSGPSKTWLCQGGHLAPGAAGESTEELHPYLRVMWKGLKLDVWL